jgi:hypothetical protein
VADQGPPALESFHVRRAGQTSWTGWAQWVPLGIGLFGVRPYSSSSPPLLPWAVGMCYAGFIVLGLALARQR